MDNKEALLDAIAAMRNSDWAPILFSEEAKKLLIGPLSAASKGPICPRPEAIFRAFNECPLGALKCVILGQDPYPNAADANGLAFSSSAPKTPKSLANIFKCLGDRAPTNGGDLGGWARQGVLLLNTALTTRESQTGAHLTAWRPYTDHIIAQIAARSAPESPLIFMLWGAHARAKRALIEAQSGNVHILEWCHPSPLAPPNKNPNDPNNFIYCDHFTKANNILQEAGLEPIDWSQ